MILRHTEDNFVSIIKTNQWFLRSCDHAL